MTRAGGVSNLLIALNRRREAIKTAWANRSRGVGAEIDQAPQRNGSKHGRFERYGAARYAEGNKAKPHERRPVELSAQMRPAAIDKPGDLRRFAGASKRAQAKEALNRALRQWTSAIDA